jgi:hypothetical protein
LSIFHQRPGKSEYLKEHLPSYLFHFPSIGGIK